MHGDAHAHRTLGYTGRLAAEYITANFPVNTRWAIAGRSESKLHALAEDCKKLNPDRNPPGMSAAIISSLPVSP
jgi:short subunit dehydrogenase-like uncharacterized protein